MLAMDQLLVGGSVARAHPGVSCFDDFQRLETDPRRLARFPRSLPRVAGSMDTRRANTTVKHPTTELSDRA